MDVDDVVGKSLRSLPRRRQHFSRRASYTTQLQSAEQRLRSSCALSPRVTRSVPADSRGVPRRGRSHARMRASGSASRGLIRWSSAGVETDARSGRSCGEHEDRPNRAGAAPAGSPDRRGRERRVEQDDVERLGVDSRRPRRFAPTTSNFSPMGPRAGVGDLHFIFGERTRILLVVLE
jgi:hypothetical protein